jgi:hypothetical protein
MARVSNKPEHPRGPQIAASQPTCPAGHSGFHTPIIFHALPTRFPHPVASRIPARHLTHSGDNDDHQHSAALHLSLHPRERHFTRSARSRGHSASNNDEHSMGLLLAFGDRRASRYRRRSWGKSRHGANGRDRSFMTHFNTSVCRILLRKMTMYVEPRSTERLSLL